MMSEPRYPLILPEPKLRFIVLLTSWKVLDWVGLNVLCVVADTRDAYLSDAKMEGGEGEDTIGGAGTHSSWNFGSRQRAPTSKMSQCQRRPGTVEGVFQWWCCRCRPPTGAGEGRFTQASLPDHPWFPEYCFPLGNAGLQKSLSDYSSSQPLLRPVTSFEKLCSLFFKPQIGGLLLQVGLLGHPRPLPLNSDHVLSATRGWVALSFDMYSIFASLSAWSVHSRRRDKTLKKKKTETIAIVLDFYGLTCFWGSVTFFWYHSWIWRGWPFSTWGFTLGCRWLSFD